MLETDSKNGEASHIFRAKGVGSKLMNKDMYERLLNGEDIIVEKEYFEPNIADGTVRIIKKPYTISGVSTNKLVDVPG